jgi:hypothetical protein
VVETGWKWLDGLRMGEVVEVYVSRSYRRRAHEIGESGPRALNRTQEPAE